MLGKLSMEAEAAVGDHRVDVLASSPSVSNVLPREGLIDVSSVATCDPKYWACPGANGLKVETCLPYISHSQRLRHCASRL